MNWTLNGPKYYRFETLHQTQIKLEGHNALVQEFRKKYQVVSWDSVCEVQCGHFHLTLLSLKYQIIENLRKRK